jgi:hypothetical protein
VLTGNTFSGLLNYVNIYGCVCVCVEELINKLRSACYMIRNIKPLMSINTLKIIYHSYFHSVMTYGVIYWGNLSHAVMVFKMQKRVIRLMMGRG